MLKNPSLIVANPNTTSSGINEHNEDIGPFNTPENSKSKLKDFTDKNGEKKRKKKYQKHHSSDKLVKHFIIYLELQTNIKITIDSCKKISQIFCIHNFNF